MSAIALTELAVHVLVALGEGPTHGYAIGKDVEARTSGRIDPSTGALYQALKRLAQDGLIRDAPSAEAASSDPRRRYFAITPAGRRALAAELARFEAIVATARDRRLYRPGS